MTLTDVAVLVRSTVRPFDLAVYREVFGVDRTGDGVPAFAFAVVGEPPGVAVDTAGGRITTSAGLDRLATADLIAIAPARTPDREVGPGVVRALRDAVGRGARVVAVSSAAFTLGAAGLLDGRRVAVGALHAAELAVRHPRALVTPYVRYVDDDPIFTSSGSAAGIDLCLHVVRKEYGAAVAATIARAMVLTLSRQSMGAAPTGSAPIGSVPIGSTSARRRSACAPTAHRRRFAPRSR